MTPRANWKGLLRVGELVCPVALYTAVSESERIALHILNRATGHRVRRRFVDEETGQPVAPDDQVKGYETGPGEHVMLEPDEIAAAVPDSDRTLAVSAFVACREIDDIYLDRSYYLAAGTSDEEGAYPLIRDALRDMKMAALAQSVLFRRVRTLLIRPCKAGLIASTLHFDYEIRSVDEAFQDIPAEGLKGEMIDLARHIIHTRMGHFDPAAFEDRYEGALAALVRAKSEGRKIEAPARPARGAVVDLMAALRASAGQKRPATRPPGGRAGPRRKAG
ncbi:Ku protein [Gluconacetobacter johannae DSM 13595]|uniref:Non-homologous end joining protein Ku n=1 Tax=Gluconacetobacter johannae TaxID=112140 RepID=A0A7W4J476_9PROT|nr:Ku protein [Gluconacetobacter johannae]MBB2174361.1 Ku protein [Gluconacetobacter johannae]GBQ85163.1 Ku protein [Gluconacetobacter johannae DSM 13595]